MVESWINDLVGIRYLKFKENAIYMGDMKMVMFSFMPILEQFNLSKKLREDRYNHLQYLSFKVSSYNFSRNQFLKLGKGINEVIEFSQEFFNKAGWGVVDFVKIDKDNEFFLINAKLNNFSDQIREIYGPQDAPVDFVNAGLFAGTLRALVKNNIQGIEIGCRAQKDTNVCQFVVSTKEKIIKYVEKFAINEKPRVEKLIEDIENLENETGVNYGKN